MAPLPSDRLLPSSGARPTPVSLNQNFTGVKNGQRRWDEWASQQPSPAAWHTWCFARLLEHFSGPPLPSPQDFSNALRPFYTHRFAECAGHPDMLQGMAEAVLELAWDHNRLHTDAVAHLLLTLTDHGANPKAPDPQGRTWMHWARSPDLQAFLAPLLPADAADAQGRTLGHFLIEDLGRCTAPHQGGGHSREQTQALVKGLEAWIRRTPEAGHQPDHEGWTPMHRLAQLRDFQEEVNIPDRFSWPGTDPHGYTALQRRLHWSFQGMCGSSAKTSLMEGGADTGWLAQHLQAFPAEAALRGPDGATAWEWILSKAHGIGPGRADIRHTMLSWLLPLDTWTALTGQTPFTGHVFSDIALSLFLVMRDEQKETTTPLPEGSAIDALFRLNPAAAAEAQRQRLSAGVAMPAVTAARPRI